MRAADATDVHRFLSDPRIYERQIERLHKRFIFSHLLYDLRQDGVSLATVIQHRAQFAAVLARTVASGDYRFEPAQVRTILVDGKSREVFSLRLTDLLVHGAVADLIEQASGPLLSSSLYSYRTGVSWWIPLSGFAAYVRAHRQARPDPRTRGLYVLRRDVASYTDSIPVGPASPLWQMLRHALGGAERSIAASDWRVIESVVRPEAYVKPSEFFTLFRGVPTGQPISCVLFNLYLHQLDHELAAIEGAFYARYSDDILFAHADPSVARQAAARMDRVLDGLGLAFNPEKTRSLYLTAAGRPSAEWDEARGTNSVPFLGCRVAADATTSLSRNKVRRLLRDIQIRAATTAHAVGRRGPNNAGRVVCSVVNRVLEPRTSVYQQRSAALLRRAVTDRRQLKQLDHWIARIVLQAVSGKSGVRAFREVSYRTLREQWGLVSVLHARNKWAKHGSSV